METKNNLFIVYSAKDDDASSKFGWIFSFHRFLEMLLGKLLRAPVSITLIEANDLDVDKIYKSNTLLIPIASEPLLNSEIFKEEIKKFHEKAIHKEKNNIVWSSRIFKVFKKPSRTHTLLDFLSNSYGYNFFHKDPMSNEIVSYTDFTGPESQKTFWMRLYDLAYDISKVLNEIDTSEDELQAIGRDLNAQYIYLAAVGSDLENERSVIRRELQRNGYNVLPENKIPNDIDAAIRMIKNDMERCKMSIHLIGADPGKIKGTNSSILELQLRISSEFINDSEKVDATKGPLSQGRVVWISPNPEKISVKQKIYIENLKKDKEVIKRAELLETNIEELKVFISNKLERQKEEEEFAVYTNEKKNKVIYLICDKEDNKKVKPLEKYLNKCGYDVIASDFEGTPDEVRIQHNNNLKKCDATLIYYAGDNEKWMKSKLQDLLKSLGLGRNKPISPQAIFIDSVEQLEEQVEVKTDTMVLQNKGRFSPKSLDPFLERLEN